MKIAIYVIIVLIIVGVIGGYGIFTNAGSIPGWALLTGGIYYFSTLIWLFVMIWSAKKITGGKNEHPRKD